MRGGIDIAEHAEAGAGGAAETGVDPCRIGGGRAQAIGAVRATAAGCRIASGVRPFPIGVPPPAASTRVDFLRRIRRIGCPARAVGYAAEPRLGRCGRGATRSSQRVDALSSKCDSSTMLDMRTTLTLDDDLAGLLQRRARELGIPLKEAVNRMIRAGLGESAAARRLPAPKTVAHSFGFRPGVDLDKSGQLADELEAEAFAEKLNDPARRKRPRSRA